MKGERSVMATWRVPGIMAVVATVACGTIVPATLPPPERDPAPSTPPASGAGAEGPADATMARFAVLLNAQREREGCEPLAWDEEVAVVAASHSRDMVERGYFSHVSPDGVDPFDRLRAGGIGFAAAAENLAFGASTGDEIFAQWMGSPPHRANMLACRYTSHGVGRYGNHWTQVLVHRR